MWMIELIDIYLYHYKYNAPQYDLTRSKDQQIDGNDRFGNDASEDHDFFLINHRGYRA